MMPGTSGEENASIRAPRMAVLLLVALPILLNAIALFPEVQNSAPSDNDQIFHYLFIERANQALAAGDNPFDHWLPELEAGFPQFFYYQNLPHLSVVALHHLLFERVSLLTLLNLVRYLLMVLFPLTVYWSMRRMEFSTVAAAVGAAFSSTLSSRLEYGFDYHSYIWSGYGMFPQLCSMHLMFIGTAFLRTVLERGKGYAGAIITSAAIVLSDLLYGYIFAISALILWILSALKQVTIARGLPDASRRIGRLAARFAIVAFGAFPIAAYQAVPFFRRIQYINREGAGGLQHSGIGISGFLSYFFSGHLFDYHRLPVVTILVALGIGYGLVTRRDDAKLALGLFFSFLILTFGRTDLKVIFAVLPLANLVPFQRLIAGGDFGAILLAGLGGELIWNGWARNFPRTRNLVPVAVLSALCAIALAERWTFYAPTQEQMRASADALQNDTDLAQVFSTLRAAPPGRIYAGTRGNWGQWMTVGGINLYDLLPVEMFTTVMPWQSLSLNSPYLWRLNTPSEELCRLFNIRYVVAPPTVRVPKSYQKLLSTFQYVLYQIDTGGYLQLGRISKVLPMPSDSALFAANSDWIASQEPAHADFIAFQSKAHRFAGGQALAVSTGSLPTDPSQLGTISNESLTPDSFSAQVVANSAALLVIKTTYHPNWHVTVDGREQRAFMVSPSFIGTMITPGRHQISAYYKSSRLKKELLILSCLTLLATIAIKVCHMEQFLFGRFSD
jgi:hypothetical protein